MTELKQKGGRAAQTARRLIPLFVLILLIGLFIKNAKLASECVRATLDLCVHTVIPSVFPCAVAAGAFIALGGAAVLGRAASAPMRFLFGISGGGACVLLAGLLCGFPLGAVTGAALVRRGELDGREFDRLLLFSGVPSPSFVISAVGGGMLSDHRLGVLLWLSLIITSVMIGILCHFFSPLSDRAPCPAPIKADCLSALGDSLRSSATSMLHICASAAFFSVITELVLEIASPIIRSPASAALVHGLFEMSGGCAAASSLGAPISPLLCAFILGWSGMGVHLQIIAAAGRINRPWIYFTVKLAQGVACAALMAAFIL